MEDPIPDNLHGGINQNSQDNVPKDQNNNDFDKNTNDEKSNDEPKREEIIEKANEDEDIRNEGLTAETKVKIVENKKEELVKKSNEEEEDKRNESENVAKNNDEPKREEIIEKANEHEDIRTEGVTAENKGKMFEHNKEELVKKSNEEEEKRNESENVENVAKNNEEPKKKEIIEKLNEEEEKKTECGNAENKGKPPMVPSKGQRKVSKEDFDIIGMIGKGSFGEVLLVKRKNTDKQFAMKAIDKTFLYKEKKQYQVYIEKEVLMKFSHPGLPKLVYSFQDKYRLYFVMEYLEGGEFSDFLLLNKKLELNVIQFYTAEIVATLEFLHTNGIAHRDLKPENMMLTATNHLKIIDFGTAYFFKTNVMNPDSLEAVNKMRKNIEGNENLGDYDQKHKATFVGTAEYVSPELLEEEECAAPADLWALGCVIYKMFTGRTPFYDQTEYLIFMKIKKLDYVMNPEIPKDAQNLIRSLLKRIPADRLGSGSQGILNDFSALKSHPFFSNIDFSNLPLTSPPPLPSVHSPFKFQGKESLEFDNLNPYKSTPPQNSLENQKKISEFDKSSISGAHTQLQAESPLLLKKIDDGKVVYTGLVLKKCGWLFYKPRQVVLKDSGWLYYYDPESNMLKGEIKLSKEDVKVTLIDKNKFSITFPKGKFYFKELELPATEFVKMLNNLLN